MTSATIENFEQSLAAVNVSCQRTVIAEFPRILEEVIVKPAIGTPLSFEGLSYDDTSVIIDPTAAEIESAKTGVTPATLGVADYGSIVVSSTKFGEGPVSLFPEKHVPVLPCSDIVADMTVTFAELGERIRMSGNDEIIATGPSATADMGELVLGAHGPREVEVIVISDR